MTKIKHKDGCGFAAFGPPAICTCGSQRGPRIDERDIVERLRNKHPLPIELEAADEIERLRAALLRIRNHAYPDRKSRVELDESLCQVHAIAYAATRDIKGL